MTDDPKDSTPMPGSAPLDDVERATMMRVVSLAVGRAEQAEFANAGLASQVENLKASIRQMMAEREEAGPSSGPVDEHVGCVSGGGPTCIYLKDGSKVRVERDGDRAWLRHLPQDEIRTAAATWEVDYDALDPGIRSLVRWLVSHGFATTDSGDGVSKAELIRDGYAEDVPHVYMLVEPENMVAEARRLRMVLEAHGADLSNGSVMIETSFSPLDKTAILALRGLDDRALPFTREAQEKKT